MEDMVPWAVRWPDFASLEEIGPAKPVPKLPNDLRPGLDPGLNGEPTFGYRGWRRIDTAHAAVFYPNVVGTVIERYWGYGPPYLMKAYVWRSKSNGQTKIIVSDLEPQF